MNGWKVEIFWNKISLTGLTGLNGPVLMPQLQMGRQLAFKGMNMAISRGILVNLVFVDGRTDADGSRHERKSTESPNKILQVLRMTG